MRIVFTWDDGSPFDKKLFDLHRKYNIPGMFFVPTFNSEGRETIDEECLKANVSDLISFGGHTYNHVFLTTLTLPNVKEEIMLNKQYLEKNIKKEIRHFCFPGGKYNKRIMEIALSCFETCRTADTLNVRNKRKVIKPTFHFYPRSYKSVLFNCAKHFNFSFFCWNLFHPKVGYFDRIKRLIERFHKRDFDVVVWGHSWEIEELLLWDQLEDLFAFIKNHFFSCVCKYDDLFSC